MKRFYAETSDLKPLVEWLKTKPEGDIRILLGGAKKDTMQNLMAGITREGRDLTEWLVKKIRTGQLEIATTEALIEGLTPNIAVED